MTKKEVNKLKIQDKVNHKDFGVCSVILLASDIGIGLEPLTKEVNEQLMKDGCEVLSFLEYDYRKLTYI